MQYAELSEVWNNSLNNKIKEVEANQRAFASQSRMPEQNGVPKPFVEENANYYGNAHGFTPNGSNNILLNTGSIIPAGEFYAEPINTYLQDEPSNVRKTPTNIRYKKSPSSSQDAHPTQSNPSRTMHSRRRKKDVNYNEVEGTYEDSDTGDEYFTPNSDFFPSEIDSNRQMYYAKKRDRRSNRRIKNEHDDRECDCDEIEKHLRKCKYCYDKYKIDDNFIVSLNYKNTLFILVISITILFIMYHMFKK